MAEQGRTTLKGYFETGDIPSDSNFGDLIDSTPNILEDNLTKYVKVELSSVDILALNTSPKELIPAPGAGKMLVPDLIIVYLQYGTSTYVSGSLNFKLGGSSTSATPFNSINITQTEDYIEWKPAEKDEVNPTSTYYLNQPFTLLQSSTNPTVGDGTLTLHIWYKEITL